MIDAIPKSSVSSCSFALRERPPLTLRLLFDSAAGKILRRELRDLALKDEKPKAKL